MAARRILIVQGHPDSEAPHFCHALARSYGEGATSAMHEVQTLDVAHLVFPLWLGDMPALLKGSLERVARPSSDARRVRRLATLRDLGARGE